MDIAQLSISVDNKDVPKATLSLEGLAVAGGKAEATTQRLTRTMATAESRAASMAKAWGAAAAA
ncbi:MAG: hypothetical protein ABIY55_11340, partial [Kofleriaceae bacterium]